MNNLKKLLYLFVKVLSCFIFIQKYRKSFRNNFIKKFSLHYASFSKSKKDMLKNSCCITYNKGIKHIISKGTKFPHPVGIVIGHKVEIGNNVFIYQNVSLGFKGGYPTIGDNVIIFPNSVIIGKIKIGDNSIIGAGSVVLKDVPNGQIWAGNPAKFIRDID